MRTRNRVNNFQSSPNLYHIQIPLYHPRVYPAQRGAGERGWKGIRGNVAGIVRQTGHAKYPIGHFQGAGGTKSDKAKEGGRGGGSE